MPAKLETQATRKAQHALIFDHYVPVQRAHSLFPGPLRNTLQKVSAETEPTNFASHDDGEFCVLAAGVDDCPSDRTYTSLFWR